MAKVIRKHKCISKNLPSPEFYILEENTGWFYLEWYPYLDPFGSIEEIEKYLETRLDIVEVVDVQ